MTQSTATQPIMQQPSDIRPFQFTAPEEELTVHYQQHPSGAHFAAWEQPAAIVDDFRAGFRSLRT